MSDVHAELLRRAAEVIGGKTALRQVLRVSMRQLDLWLHGIERPPSYVFLKAVDIIAEQPPDGAARDPISRSRELRRESELVRQAAIAAHIRADDVLSRAAAAFERSRVIRGRLLESAAMQMGSDAASVQLLDAEKNELLLLGWTGFHPDSAAHWQRVPCGSESTCGAALKQRQRVIVADVNDPACGLTQEGIACYNLSGLVAVQSTPVVSRDGRLLGMLSTHWRRSHEPADRDLAQFDVLARHAADLLAGVDT